MSDKIGQLKMLAPDGKMRSTDVADQEQLFRLVQSIPSPKVEPIKVWIAKVASERIDEMIAPELSIDRAAEGDFVFFRRDQGGVEAAVLEVLDYCSCDFTCVFVLP